MTAVKDSVVEALAATNLTSLCDQRMQLAELANANLIANTNLAMQNAVTNQQELNKLGLAALGQSIRMINGGKTDG